MYYTIPGTVFNSQELMTNKIYDPTYTGVLCIDSSVFYEENTMHVIYIYSHDTKNL